MIAKMNTTEIDILAKSMITALSNDDRALYRFSEFLAKAIHVLSKEKLPNLITKNVAHKHFGRKNVDEWILKKMIQIEQRGNRVMLSLSRLRELEDLSKDRPIYNTENSKIDTRPDCINAV